MNLPIWIDSGKPCLMCLDVPATKLSSEERTLCSFLYFAQTYLFSHYVSSGFPGPPIKDKYVFHYCNKHYEWALELLVRAQWVEKVKDQKEIPWGKTAPSPKCKRDLGQGYRLLAHIPHDPRRVV